MAWLILLDIFLLNHINIILVQEPLNSVMLLRYTSIGILIAIKTKVKCLTGFFTQNNDFILHVFDFFFQLEQAIVRQFLIFFLVFLYVTDNIIYVCYEANRLIQSFHDLKISFGAHIFHAVLIFLHLHHKIDIEILNDL